MGRAEQRDDEDSWDEELAAEWAAEEQGGRDRRWWALLTSSYGLSAAVHVAALLVLATIIITGPPAEKEVELKVSTAPPLPPYEEERPRDLKRQELVPIPEQAEVPLIVRETEVEVAVTVPKGTELTNATNKNLADTRLMDTYGTGGGGPCGAFGDRQGKGSLVDNGGGKETEDAVRAALLWLRDHQAPDGSWGAAGWAQRCGRGPKHLAACQGPPGPTGRSNPGLGEAQHDVGVSALALLAYLGNGQTHRVGPFKETVRRGLRFLRRTQAQDGSVGFRGPGPTIYDHALSTMALCEAYAITRDLELRRPAQAAVDFALAAQNPGFGWRYGVRPGDNDTSVTGWFILALKAARTAGLAVPDRAFFDARAWLDRTTSSRGATGYAGPDGLSAVLGGNEAHYEPVPCMTAVGVVCRLFTGQKASERAVRQGAQVLSDCPPAWEPRRLNFYYWYYATYAQFQVGGQAWERWNPAMKEALLPHQRQGGCEDGSWDPIDEWGGPGGRVYATAINALTLEIYYRYERQEKLAAGKLQGAK